MSYYEKFTSKELAFLIVLGDEQSVGTQMRYIARTSTSALPKAIRILYDKVGSARYVNYKDLQKVFLRRGS